MEIAAGKFGPKVLSQPPAGGTRSKQRAAQPRSRDIKTKPKRGLLFRACKWTLWILCALGLIRTFIGEASLVPTASMEGTILVGDHLFWNKALYGPEIPFTPWRLPRLKRVHRGEIVAFHYPLDPEQIFLKRVVAMGGDRVEIRNDVLYVNGSAVQENYAVHRRTLRFRFAPSEMAARTVPAGTLFMLGDNRDNSSDSRDWGVVPEENVIGSPLVVFWSYDAPSSEWLDDQPSHRLRFFASMCTHLFSRTRWERTGILL
jgi:signal peptidase I